MCIMFSLLIHSLMFLQGKIVTNMGGSHKRHQVVIFVVVWYEMLYHHTINGSHRAHLERLLPV